MEGINLKENRKKKHRTDEELRKHNEKDDRRKKRRILKHTERRSRSKKDRVERDVMKSRKINNRNNEC